MKSHDAFALLADADRCHVIRKLLAGNGSSTVDALSGHVAARLEETDATQAEVALVHTHLPKLVGANAVEHSNGVVVLTETGAALAPLLDAAQELDGEASERLVSC